MNDPKKEAREIAARHGVKMYEPPAEAKQEPGCECRARKALDGIVPMIQKRADELGELGSRALSDPCPCEQLRGELTELKEQEAAQMVEDARAATDAVVAERDAAQSLLEEAREALAYVFQLCSPTIEAGQLTHAIVAKIEAAGKPEVKP